MIDIKDVYKRYKTKHGMGEMVLQGVTVTIPSGVNVGLIGGNGAGKSTLLRLIGGVDHPTRGTVERDCRISWPVGQGGVELTLTGRQNAKFVYRVYGHHESLEDRVAFIHDFSGLRETFDEPVYTYSTGMRSRLQFSMSMAFDFDVYISDEVTAAGDKAFRRKATAAFKNLSNSAGLIMVAHNEKTLKDNCQSGIWLFNGKAHWFDRLDDALKAYNEHSAK